MDSRAWRHQEQFWWLCFEGGGCHSWRHRWWWSSPYNFINFKMLEIIFKMLSNYLVLLIVLFGLSIFSTWKAKPVIDLAVVHYFDAQVYFAKILVNFSCLLSVVTWPALASHILTSIFFVVRCHCCILHQIYELTITGSGIFSFE